MINKMMKKREIKKTRKDKEQRDKLMQLYHKTKGDPSREQTLEIANAVDLKEIQVYKFMWDQR